MPEHDDLDGQLVVVTQVQPEELKRADEGEIPVEERKGHGPFSLSHLLGRKSQVSALDGVLGTHRAIFRRSMYARSFAASRDRVRRSFSPGWVAVGRSDTQNRDIARTEPPRVHPVRQAVESLVDGEPGVLLGPPVGYRQNPFQQGLAEEILGHFPRYWSESPTLLQVQLTRETPRPTRWMKFSAPTRTDAFLAATGSECGIVHACRCGQSTRPSCA